MAKIAPVKGTRDFYPDRMAIRNWIVEGWRSTSLRNGFVEYDGPIFEYLQLYTQKSGDEIAGQLFSFTDRGGRDLAIRPEITPTLARMVNQQINSLPRPIKWFSVPRLCRAERPQKGRLREFFQWNIDIIGSDSILADAECIYTAVDYLRSIGLTSNDVVVKISSRAMLAELLKDIGFAEDQLDTIYALLDKRLKIPAETFAEMTKEKIPDQTLRDKLMKLFSSSFNNLISSVIKAPDNILKPIKDLEKLFDYLNLMGIKDYYEFDINIVRGLAYYTGAVYEIFDRKQPLRALCGGGRYDNLLEGLGGPQIPATGFGLGDVVLEIMLQERGLLKTAVGQVDVFIINAGVELYDKAIEITCQLREKGFTAVFSYKHGANVGKQLKQASEQNARCAVILGSETQTQNEITLKNLANGNQQKINLSKFLTQPGNYL